MDAFLTLYRRLVGVDFFGNAGEPMPQPTDLPEAVSEGTTLLPRVYVDAYAVPLMKALPRLLELLAANRFPALALETLTGPAYQLRPGDALDSALQRFLAVVSNLYRSFLAAEKRQAATLPLRTSLPPLALFQHSGGIGPFTVTADDTQQLIGADVSIASLPATYAAHPLVWAILAHEVTGHSVTHADPGLLAEIAAGTVAAISALTELPETLRQALALVWAYWIDEATADVYGLLNIGPAFCPNMAAFFAAARAQGMPIEPKLRMESRFAASDPAQTLDTHPTDILRLHLASGVVNVMTKLSPDARSQYLKYFADLSALLSSGDTVTITGAIPMDRDHYQPVDLQVPLAVMAEVARRVGEYIATAQLTTIGGHSIQDVETWDDSDESRAHAVRDALLADRSIVALGDDAHLLAGATLAFTGTSCVGTEFYETVIARLNEALDDSFRRDPIWGMPKLKTMFLPRSFAVVPQFWREPTRQRPVTRLWGR